MPSQNCTLGLPSFGESYLQLCRLISVCAWAAGRGAPWCPSRGPGKHGLQQTLSDFTGSETLGTSSAGCLGFRIKGMARGFVKKLNASKIIISAPSECSSLCPIPPRGSVILEKPSGDWSFLWAPSIFWTHFRQFRNFPYFSCGRSSNLLCQLPLQHSTGMCPETPTQISTQELVTQEEGTGKPLSLAM